MVTEQRVRDALAEVKDPEIPAVSITDLGIVERVAVTADAVEVDLLPTFTGCPALEIIALDVEAALAAVAPGRAHRVRYVRTAAWTTDRITPAGREKLRSFGIAPPGDPVVVQLGPPQQVPCPFCGSDATQKDSAFGPTPCRAIRYCPTCRNPFEAFKPKG